MWRVLSLGPKGVEITCKLKQVEGDSVRLVGHCGGLNEARIESDTSHQGEFGSIIESRQCSPREHAPPLEVDLRQVRDHLAGIAKNGLSPSVAILDIEHRVVARLLNHLGEVEVQYRIVLSVEHHEADSVNPDFVDDLTQCHEISGTL